MIIFHEGLPRSGKSYEAIKEHIIPALTKGRKVFARINGLNYEQIAKLADITLEECQQLLFHITEEQVPTIYEHVENDALVVIDELQNFFPSGRGKLSDDMTKFITEHGHSGLDILTMGQAISDCHNLWRKRTQRKIQFLKLDMVGKDNSYKWTAYTNRPDPKGEPTWVKITSGTKKYDPAYFGAYLSHQPDTENKDNLEDARLNIFNAKSLRYGVPLVLFLAVYAVYHLYSFFSSPSVVTVEQNPPHHVETNHTPQQHQQHQQPPRRPTDFVMSNDQRYTPKLTYMSSYFSFIQDFLVVWEDSQGRVQDMLYMDGFRDMGYTFEKLSMGVRVRKGDYEQIYRWMPVHESWGRVPVQTQNELSGS
ncbi:zonular occludens toxin family protein [Alkalimonas mucilaginosa]|uniref:Zonular occludens toxin domain-containing protein n=1 Tax=Alkalimonas mucilaginosa TaxID=3057676 RepID=A0ABU7JD43_9GAMM|nr:zonular occludens toxin domain-containing protein [Alkalimonas sp. MEB004]MEE2023612.1 zonular occludens toxin domain-containing protein [Alkalimonas sp. MEB004]